MWTRQATALTNENRQRIYDHVRANGAPGVREVADDLELHYNTVLYHARRLQRAGLLRLDRNGTQLVCVDAVAAPGPAAPRPGRPAAPPPLDGLAAAALDALVKPAPRSAADVARVLGVHRSTAHAMLCRMESRGLVRRSGFGWVPAPTRDAPNPFWPRRASLAGHDGPAAAPPDA